MTVQRSAQQRHAAIVQRHVAILAEAGFRALVQRHQDGDHRVQARADIDDRLRKIAYGPEMTEVVLKWCRQCDKFYARCACQTPSFFIISAGQDVTTQTYRSLDGHGVMPDLEHR